MHIYTHANRAGYTHRAIAEAIDGLVGSVQLECNGFDLSGRWGLSEGGMGWWGREGGRQD